MANKHGRETIEDIKDIPRLQRIERFHRLQIEEFTKILENIPPDHSPFELIDEYALTPKEMANAIDDHANNLRRVSYRIAELTILEE